MKGDIQSFARLIRGVENLLREASVPSRFFYDVLIAVDEIFSNIVIHGYRNEPGGSIRVAASIDDKKFEITFVDHGAEFKPRDEQPRLGKALLTGEYPGLGLFITKNLMDEFHYEHVNGENRTRLVKNISPEEEKPGGAEK